MNKIQLISLCLFFSLIFHIYTYAQSKNDNVDWDKIEYHLYQDLRNKYPNKSEAEIEEAIGHGLLHSDNWRERATVHFKKALELNPNLYISWYNLGLIYADEEEGRGYFRKAIKVKPDFAPPYYWLGYSLCREKRDEEALPVFEKYLKIAKGDPQEKDRFEFASSLIEELCSGKEGESLKMIRRPAP